MRFGSSLIFLFVCCRRPGTLDIRKGANFTAAMAFQFASTNLVVAGSRKQSAIVGSAGLQCRLRAQLRKSFSDANSFTTSGYIP